MNMQPHPKSASLDPKQLRLLYKEDEGARRFFDRVKDSKNDVAQTTVDRLKQMAGLDERSDALNLCKKLAAANCGKVRMGRRGSKSRIVWAYSRRSIAEIAAGKSENTVDLKLDDELAEDVLDTAGDDIEYADHRFPLRAEVDVVIKLPKDVTKHEVQRLSNWILTLSFTD